MKRRAFIAALSGVGFGWPLSLRAEKASVRIGYLSANSAASRVSADAVAAIKEGLADNGLIEGRDYLFEARFVDGKYERFPAKARELSEARVHIIIANTIAAVHAAQALTPAVPIVMAPINDPVGNGLIASLARPGGLTTGLATLNEDTTVKLLEYQRTMLPKSATTAALFNPKNPSNIRAVTDLQRRGKDLGITIDAVALDSPDTLDDAFAKIAENHPDALQVIGDSSTLGMSDLIAAKALALGLPSFGAAPAFGEYGGLIGYGASRQSLLTRAGYYVKKILDGANPGELPVEQPTKIELWLNLKTAKALNLAIPPTLIAIADEVIE